MKHLIVLLAIAPLAVCGQPEMLQPVYYAGFNPVAPFTGIRTNFTSGTLPAAGNLESGVSLFIGKIWNRNYNLETRVSYGSPFKYTRQFVVQSGIMYCFNNKHNDRSLMSGTYAGMFVKLQEFMNTKDDSEKKNAVLYWSAGRRFVFKRCFADVRISQQLLSLKWTNEKNSKGVMGFHNSPYNWKSPYIPLAGIGLGYILNKS